MTEFNYQDISKSRRTWMIARNSLRSTVHEESAGLEIAKAPEVITDGIALAYAMASEDANPRYFAPGSSPASPLLASRMLKDVLEGVLLHPSVGMNLLKMVHAEQSFRFVEPLRVGMTLSSRARVRGFRKVSSGTLMDIDVSLFEGEKLVVEGASVMFLRGGGSGKGGGRPASEPELVVPPLEEVARMKVLKDQPTRYAAASGDYNPIHRKNWAAKMAGFKAPIAHGLCVMSMVTGKLIHLYAGGDPTMVRRIAVRFSKPAYPGKELVLKAALKDGVVHFQLEDSRGKVILSRATMEVGSELP